MQIEACETSDGRGSRSNELGPSLVFIERGACWLVDAALAAAQVSQRAVQFEGESLSLGVRDAGYARPGTLTFVAAEDSSDELRQQLYALVQVLIEGFPRASVRVRFVARPEAEKRGA